MSTDVEQQLRERIRKLEARIEASSHRQHHVRRSDRMEAIGRVAGRIAHDFNNLLTSIKGLSSLALSELEPGNPIRSDLEEIEKAAQRAAALTRQLLGVSRRQALKLVPVDLNAAVAGLVARLEGDLDERIELRATCAPELPRVLGDPGQLDLVLANLVANAGDAMPHGGTIEITTRLAHVTDDRSPVEPGRYALLTVRDSGTGIDPEHVDRIFEPFFTTRETVERAGFGLATAFVSVQQSGGYIDVESSSGVGSTFLVYLPLAEEPSAASAEPADGRETVLLADQDPAARALVVDTLEAAGYHVLPAESASRATAIADQHDGDVQLLLIDLAMPRKDAQDLHEHLRRRWPGVRVLYMSSYTDDAVGGRQAEDPDGTPLVKPFLPEALLTRVRRVLDRESPTFMDR